MVKYDILRATWTFDSSVFLITREEVVFGLQEGMFFAYKLLRVGIYSVEANSIAIGFITCGDRLRVYIVAMPIHMFF